MAVEICPEKVYNYFDGAADWQKVGNLYSVCIASAYVIWDVFHIYILLGIENVVAKIVNELNFLCLFLI